jgi:hypothetical protein
MRAGGRTFAKISGPHIAAGFGPLVARRLPQYLGTRPEAAPEATCPRQPNNEF